MFVVSLAVRNSRKVIDDKIKCGSCRFTSAEPNDDHDHDILKLVIPTIDKTTQKRRYAVMLSLNSRIVLVK